MHRLTRVYWFGQATQRCRPLAITAIQARLPWRQKPDDQTSLYKMKVTLVRQQLRWSDVLNGDRVVRGIRDDGIAVSVIVGRRQESGHVCKDRLADLDCVFCGVEVRNGNLTKIRREDERALVRHGEGRLARASDLAGSIIVSRPAQRARLAGYWRGGHESFAAAGAREFGVWPRVCSRGFEIHGRRFIADGGGG